MKKFKFSLDKVLTHRQIQVDLAKKEFIDAENFLDSELKNLQTMLNQKQSALNQRTLAVQGSMSWANSVDQINIFLTGQDLRIKKQNERLLECRKVVESKREILQEALTAAKMIDRLREKKKVQYFQEVLKNEQKEIDELSVIRFSKTEN